MSVIHLVALLPQTGALFSCNFSPRRRSGWAFRLLLCIDCRFRSQQVNECGWLPGASLEGNLSQTSGVAASFMTSMSRAQSR